MDERESAAGLPPAREPSRRQFIERTGVTAGGIIALGLASGPRVPAASAASAEATAPTALTPGELTTLRAILARALPADTLGPGAVEMGAAVYINRALAGNYAALLPFYQQNLAAIDAAAKTQGVASFAALSAPRQDTLLQQVEAGKAGGASASVFFQVLLQHMREGLFGDPMYGGNHAFAGWDLIGYPGIKLVWTAKEQAIGTKIVQTHTSDITYGGHVYNGPTS